MNNKKGKVNEILKIGDLTTREIKEELWKRNVSFVRSYDRAASIAFCLFAILWLLPAIANWSGWRFLSFFAQLVRVNFPTVAIVIGVILLAADTFIAVKVILLLQRRGGTHDAHEPVVLIKEGPYRIVRHPGYLIGLFWIPLLCIVLSKWIPYTIFAIALTVEWLSMIGFLIKAEDKFNVRKWGDEYREYMKEVPAINFVNGLWNVAREKIVKQVRKPTGRFGRLIARLANIGDSRLTQWGLSHLSINKDDIILDVGCGGGKTVNRLANRAIEGKVYGIDYSEACVEVSKKVNKKFIEEGRVEILHGSVESLPFPDDFFDLITVVEAYYFFPDLVNNLKEIRRVLKPGGLIALINEAYRGGRFEERIAKWARAGHFRVHSPEEFREFLKDAGYSSIQIDLLENKNWITAIGTKR